MGRNWRRAQPQGPAPRQFLTRQTMFGNLKTKGFALEATHLTDPDKLCTLLALLAFAVALTGFDGERHGEGEQREQGAEFVGVGQVRGLQREALGLEIAEHGLSGKELARCRTLRLGPSPVPPHKNHS